MKDDCIFCRIKDKKIPASIVYEDESVIAFKDIKPKAPVHIVIIPKRHIERVSELESDDSELISRMMLAAVKIADDNGLAGPGYRFVINCNKDAGQEVFHLHMHILGGRKMGWPPG